MTSAADPTSRYLDGHALASIKSLELRARIVVDGLLSGMHRSPAQGVSVEFAQHRQYAPGDDLRRLDWKVYGRTDKLYVKQQQRESNLDVWLMVDISGSMNYGSVKSRTGETWTKFDHAATAASSIAYLALRQQDRVGMVVFDDRIRSDTIRPSNAHDHWRSIVAVLSTVAPGRDRGTIGSEQPHGSTDIDRLIDQVLAGISQRGLLVLISDLFDDPESIERSMAKACHHGHDAILLQVLDPAEREFPFRAPTEFVGLEMEGRLPTSPAALRASYLSALGAHQRKIADVARRFRFDHEVLDTSSTMGPPLSMYLARRASTMRRGRG